MFNKLNETKEFRYSSYKEMAKKSPYFQEGINAFKKGIIKQETKTCYWVKKEVKNREYERDYKKNNSYYVLDNIGGTLTSSGKRIGGKKVIAFMTINPLNLMPLNDEEIIKIDDYRRIANIYPRPCKEIK